MTRSLVLVGFAAILAIPAAWGQGEKPTISDGRARLRSGDPAAAAKIFRAVTGSEPTNGQAWYLLGYALHAAGMLEDAVDAHEKAATFPKLRARSLYNLGCALALLGETEEALEAVEKAVAAGFGNRHALRTDPDLASLRESPRFLKLAPPMLVGADAFVEDVRVIHTFDAKSANEQFGWVARLIGDVDGDGVIDFATSSPSRGGGRVFVYSSKSGKLLFTRDGQAGQSYGQGVAAAGDIDRDGTPDVIVGAPNGGKGIGRAHVLSGKNGDLILELLSGDTNDNFGMKVAGAEDFDGDGVPELLVGASSCDAAGTDAGRFYVFSGKSGRQLAAVDGTAPGGKLGSSIDATRSGGHRLIVVGAMAYQGKGRASIYRWEKDRVMPKAPIDAGPRGATLGMYFVSIIGDIDADGVPDIYASDWNDSTAGKQAGRVYVHSGKDFKRLLVIDGHRPGEGFGTSISQAGDADGDGHDDLIVGAWQNRDGAVSGGKCYLHSGKDGRLLSTYTSRQAGDTLGFDAQGIGDVDGDGVIDFLLTAAWSEVAGPRSGRIFIVAGKRLPGPK